MAATQITEIACARIDHEQCGRRKKRKRSVDVGGEEDVKKTRRWARGAAYARLTSVTSAMIIGPEVTASHLYNPLRQHTPRDASGDRAAPRNNIVHLRQCSSHVLLIVHPESRSDFTSTRGCCAGMQR